MKLRSTSALVLAAILMAGCQSVHLPGPIDKNCACQSDKPVEVRFDPTAGIGLDRPIILVPRGSNRPIQFSLDPKLAGVRFAGDKRGIVIEGRILDRIVRNQDQPAVVLDPRPAAFPDGCTTSADGRQVSCTYKSIGPAAYKYTVRIVVNDKTFEIDPLIVEM